MAGRERKSSLPPGAAWSFDTPSKELQKLNAALPESMRRPLLDLFSMPLSQGSLTTLGRSKPRTRTNSLVDGFLAPMSRTASLMDIDTMSVCSMDSVFLDQDFKPPTAYNSRSSRASTPSRSMFQSGYITPRRGRSQDNKRPDTPMPRSRAATPLPGFDDYMDSKSRTATPRSRSRAVTPIPGFGDFTGIRATRSRSVTPARGMSRRQSLLSQAGDEKGNKNSPQPHENPKKRGASSSIGPSAKKTKSGAKIQATAKCRTKAVVTKKNAAANKKKSMPVKQKQPAKSVMAKTKKSVVSAKQESKSNVAKQKLAQKISQNSRKKLAKRAIKKAKTVTKTQSKRPAIIVSAAAKQLKSLIEIKKGNKKVKNGAPKGKSKPSPTLKEEEKKDKEKTPANAATVKDTKSKKLDDQDMLDKSGNDKKKPALSAKNESDGNDKKKPALSAKNDSDGDDKKKPALSPKHESDKTLKTLTAASNILQLYANKSGPSTPDLSSTAAVVEATALAFVGNMSPRSVSNATTSTSPVVTVTDKATETDPVPNALRRSPKPSNALVTVPSTELNGIRNIGTTTQPSPISPINSLASKLRHKLSQSPTLATQAESVRPPKVPLLLAGPMAPIINSLSAAAKQTSSFMKKYPEDPTNPLSNNHFRVNKKLLYQKLKQTNSNARQPKLHTLKGKMTALFKNTTTLIEEHARLEMQQNLLDVKSGLHNALIGDTSKSSALGTSPRETSSQTLITMPVLQSAFTALPAKLLVSSIPEKDKTTDGHSASETLDKTESRKEETVCDKDVTSSPSPVVDKIAVVDKGIMAIKIPMAADKGIVTVKSPVAAKSPAAEKSTATIQSPVAGKSTAVVLNPVASKSTTVVQSLVTSKSTAPVISPMARKSTAGVQSPMASKNTALVLSSVARKTTAGVQSPVASKNTAPVLSPVARKSTAGAQSHVASKNTAPMLSPVARKSTAGVQSPVASKTTSPVLSQVASKSTTAVQSTVARKSPAASRSPVASKSPVSSKSPVTAKSVLDSKGLVAGKSSVVMDKHPATDKSIMDGKSPLTDKRILDGASPMGDKSPVVAKRILNFKVSATDKSPVTDKSPLAGKSPVADKSPVTDKSILDGKGPTVDKQCVADKNISNDKSPVVCKRIIVDSKLPVIEKSAVTVPSELPTQSKSGASDVVKETEALDMSVHTNSPEIPYVGHTDKEMVHNKSPDLSEDQQSSDSAGFHLHLDISPSVSPAKPRSPADSQKLLQNGPSLENSTKTVSFPFEEEDLVAKKSVLGALGLRSKSDIFEQASAPKVPKLRLVCRPTHKKHRRSTNHDSSSASYKDKTYTVCREGDSMVEWNLLSGNSTDPLDTPTRSVMWYPRMPISNGKVIETLAEVSVPEPGVGVGDGMTEEPKEGAEKSSGLLVIPEKSSSFAIHPSRLCEDVCCYCRTKFGLYDTPLHVAQLKGGDEKQQAVLARETVLTLESCLCDACFRHLDRPGNPKPKTVMSKPKPQPNELCCFDGCSNPGIHGLMRKSKRRVRAQLKPDHQDPKASNWVCDKHYTQITRISSCAMCQRRCANQQLYKLEESAVPRLNKILRNDNVLVPLSGESYLCKKCRYYASLRLRNDDFTQFNVNNRAFLREHRHRLLKCLDIDPDSIPDIFAEQDKPKKQQPKKKSSSPEVGIGSNAPPSPSKAKQKAQKAPSPKLAVKIGSANLKSPSPLTTKTASPKTPISILKTQFTPIQTSASTTAGKGSLRALVPKPLLLTTQTMENVRHLVAPNASSSLSISRVTPSSSKPTSVCILPLPPGTVSPRTTTSTTPTALTRTATITTKSSTSSPSEHTIIINTPPVRPQASRSPPKVSVKEAPSNTQQVGLHANFEFNSTEQRNGWQKINATFQFDRRTRQMWHRLHAPYGSYTSFLRHLVMLETHWRNGDLVMSPRASRRSRHYLTSVQNRIQAFEGIPSESEASAAFDSGLRICDVRSLAADQSGSSGRSSVS